MTGGKGRVGTLARETREKRICGIRAESQMRRGSQTYELGDVGLGAYETQVGGQRDWNIEKEMMRSALQSCLRIT